MELTYAEQKMLTLAETLRAELNDTRLCDDDGTPLQAVPDPLPAVAFMDAEQKRRAQLEEAPDNRWLLQFFDKAGRLHSTRSGRMQTA
jgi:hypothetical protein